MREVYLKIEGRVQGIGYRRWAVAKALEIGGISGWVRNEDDGSVEILMSGDEEKIDEMIKSCYRGLIFVIVDKISSLPAVRYFSSPPSHIYRFHMLHHSKPLSRYLFN